VKQPTSSPSACPEVRNWFDQIKFQGMYFCDVINKSLKCQIMCFKTWEQVTDYISKLESVPAWYEVNWGDPSPYALVKQKFEELVKKREVSDCLPYS